MLKRLLSLAALVVATTAAHAAVPFSASSSALPNTPRGLTLDEAVRHAWARDSQVAALTLSSQLAQARELQAGLRPSPRLQAQTALPLDSKSEWALALGLSQSLPRRERVTLARAYARLGGETAPITLALRRAALADNVRRLWYALAVQDARARLAEQTLAANLALVEDLAPRRAAGEVTDSDWFFWQREVGRATQAQALAQAERDAALAALRARLRWPEGEPLPPLQVALDPLLEAARGESEATEMAAEFAALPRLALARHKIAEAQTALDLARSESREDWTLGAGIEVERRANDASGRLASEPRLTLSTSAPWPVRPSRAPNRGIIAERETALRIAQAEHDALRDEVAAKAAAALATVRALQPVVSIYRDFAQQASSAQSPLHALLERGEIGLRDLAQAQQQQSAIEAEFLNAASRYLSALADLEAFNPISNL